MINNLHPYATVVEIGHVPALEIPILAGRLSPCSLPCVCSREMCSVPCLY